MTVSVTTQTSLLTVHVWLVGVPVSESCDCFGFTLLLLYLTTVSLCRDVGYNNMSYAIGLLLQVGCLCARPFTYLVSVCQTPKTRDGGISNIWYTEVGVQ